MFQQISQLTPADETSRKFCFLLGDVSRPAGLGTVPVLWQQHPGAILRGARWNALASRSLKTYKDVDPPYLNRDWK